MFRYERPQKGRQRQFDQFGVEFMSTSRARGSVPDSRKSSSGSGYFQSSPFASAECEAESIALACRCLDRFFEKLNGIDDGIDTNGSRNPHDSTSNAINWMEALNLRLHVNYLGGQDTDSRKRYKETLGDFFSAHYEKLSQESQDRFSRGSILRILDSKETEDLELFDREKDSMPTMADALSPECKERDERIWHTLHRLLPTSWNKSRIVKDPKLVRGLDYYSGTVFEICATTSTRQLAVLAGGRYDGLFRHLANINNRKETLRAEQSHGVGWALGMDRLLTLCEDVLQENVGKNTTISQQQEKQIRIFGVVPKRSSSVEKDHLLPASVSRVLSLVGMHFRERLPGHDVSISYDACTSVSKQLGNASKVGTDFCIFTGTNEMNDINEMNDTNEMNDEEESVDNSIVIVKNMQTGKEKRVTISQIDESLFK